MRLTAAALILFVSTGFVPQDVDVLKDSDASRTKVDRLRDERILSRLATQKITIDLHSVALTEFINQMRSATGLNFAIMHVEDPTVEVTVKLISTEMQIVFISISPPLSILPFVSPFFYSLSSPESPAYRQQTVFLFQPSQSQNENESARPRR